MSEESVGKAVVLRFLRDYGQFGSLGHLLAAQAFREKIQLSNKPDERKLLAVKVYAEFISSLEDLGALCIAIRHREEGVGLVYAYLTYGPARRPKAPPTTLAEIYEIATEGDGLHSALRLPSLQDIVSKVPYLAGTAVSELYEQTNRLLSMAGKAYLYENSAFVRAYNKTKHGFVVVSDENIFQPSPPSIKPDMAWIVSENPQYDPDNPADKPVVEIYAVEVKDVDWIIERIVPIRGAVVIICDLVATLLERGMVSSGDDRA